MLGLSISKQKTEQLNVLCIGAHADDIEIGCGGTLLSLRANWPEVNFCWIVLCATGPRCAEATRAAELFTAGRPRQTFLKDYRDGFLPYEGGKVKDFFESLKKIVDPDLIFTHWGCDAHQDHRLISELTWNTFRNHLILEYEIPKYDGDVGRPNLFVPLDELTVGHKVEYLFDAFASQQSKRWFDREMFKGLMRIRGMESNSASGYAEAFHCRKIICS
jgi:LmbE family N-acetylglucosaminyl deacetylase